MRLSSNNIDNINLIGQDYFNYVTSISGYTIGNITQSTIAPTFYINKYYDKTQVAPIFFSLSGIYDNDLVYVTLSSGFYGLYRDYNANIGINVDVSNIRLTGPLAYNYKIINYTTVSGNIFAKYLTTTARFLLSTVSISKNVFSLQRLLDR